MNVAGVAGFLVAKAFAALRRHEAKDYYDIAFVLLHHDPADLAPADLVTRDFEVVPGLRTPLLDLAANFAHESSFGTVAYRDQFLQDHPGTDDEVAAADAMLAVGAFAEVLLSRIER